MSIVQCIALLCYRATPSKLALALVALALLIGAAGSAQW